VLEKCTVCVFRVTEPSSGGCRSNWEEWMCYWNRKCGKMSGNWKLWNGEVAKKPVLAQWDFRHWRRGKLVKEKWFRGEKGNAVFSVDGTCYRTQTHFSAEYSLQWHCFQKTNPIYTLLRNTLSFNYLLNVFLNAEIYLYPPSEDIIFLPIWNLIDRMCNQNSPVHPAGNACYHKETPVSSATNVYRI